MFDELFGGDFKIVQQPPFCSNHQYVNKYLGPTYVPRPELRSLLAAKLSVLKPPCMFLAFGPAGCGKTSLLADVFREYKSPASEDFWLDSTDLESSLKGCVDDSRDDWFEEAAESLTDEGLFVKDSLLPQFLKFLNENEDQHFVIFLEIPEYTVSQKLPKFCFLKNVITVLSTRQYIDSPKEDLKTILENGSMEDEDIKFEISTFEISELKSQESVQLFFSYFFVDSFFDTEYLAFMAKKLQWNAFFMTKLSQFYYKHGQKYSHSERMYAKGLHIDDCINELSVSEFNCSSVEQYSKKNKEFYMSLGMISLLEIGFIPNELIDCLTNYSLPLKKKLVEFGILYPARNSQLYYLNAYMKSYLTKMNSSFVFECEQFAKVVSHVKSLPIFTSEELKSDADLILYHTAFQIASLIKLYPGKDVLALNLDEVFFERILEFSLFLRNVAGDITCSKTILLDTFSCLKEKEKDLSARFEIEISLTEMIECNFSHCEASLQNAARLLYSDFESPFSMRLVSDLKEIDILLTFSWACFYFATNRTTLAADLLAELELKIDERRKNISKFAQAFRKIITLTETNAVGKFFQESLEVLTQELLQESFTNSKTLSAILVNVLVFTFNIEISFSDRGLDELGRMKFKLSQRSYYVRDLFWFGFTNWISFLFDASHSSSFALHCLGSYLRSCGDDSLLLSCVLEWIASNYFTDLDLVSASLWRSIVSIRRSRLGPEHPLTAFSVVALTRRVEFEESRDFLFPELDFVDYSKGTEVEKRKLASASGKIGKILCACDFADALPYLVVALKASQSEKEALELQFLIVSGKTANSGSGSLKACLTLMEDLLQRADSETYRAEVFTMIAKVYYDLGDLVNAESYANNAVKCAESSGAKSTLALSARALQLMIKEKKSLDMGK